MSLELSRRLVGDVTVIARLAESSLTSNPNRSRRAWTNAAHEHKCPAPSRGRRVRRQRDLGLLVRTSPRQNAGGALKLCALSSKVDDVLWITRLEPYSRIYATEAESIADVHGAPERQLLRRCLTSSAWIRRLDVLAAPCASCSNNRATGCSRRPICLTL